MFVVFHTIANTRNKYGIQKQSSYEQYCLNCNSLQYHTTSSCHHYGISQLEVYTDWLSVGSMYQSRDLYQKYKLYLISATRSPWECSVTKLPLPDIHVGVCSVLEKDCPLDLSPRKMDTKSSMLSLGTALRWAGFERCIGVQEKSLMGQQDSFPVIALLTSKNPK